MNNRLLEIFWGTGGVGKTTLAASRALFLSKQNKKILLITIDPSRRLKQIFDIENNSVGKIVKIDSFEMLIFNPEETFKRMLGSSASGKDLNNRILNILMRPYGGMNEIMAILEIQHQLSQKKYDTIILDTPPGEHFIDFVKSSQKIRAFFDKKFIDVVKYFTSNTDSKSKNIFNMITKTGIDTILKYMKVITGASFVEEFISVVSGVHNNKETFLRTLDFEKNLQEKNFCHWFLITSVGRNKLEEVISLQDKLEKNFRYNEFLVVNKSIEHHLDKWNISKDCSLYGIKKTMSEGERQMIQLAKASFERVLVFPEILSSSPQIHIKNLSQFWQKQIINV